MSSKDVENESKFIYKEVYNGIKTQCLITNEILENMYISHERTPPAVTFRIVAKNSKGCGPITQIRWVQS